jgi:hypothetical protein
VEDLIVLADGGQWGKREKDHDLIRQFSRFLLNHWVSENEREYRREKFWVGRWMDEVCGNWERLVRGLALESSGRLGKMRFAWERFRD